MVGALERAKSEDGIDMAATKRKPKLATASSAVAVDDDTLLTYYREMLLIRRFEERAGQLYGMGLIGGFLHLYIGQEAVVTGVEHAITHDDPVITSYRCHAHMLARGVDPKLVMAELAGRGSGTSAGKGGSMHLFAPEKQFYGGHGIVGAQVPIGTGLAFALKYRETDRLCVTYFGDGAANQGQVHEAYNMAALWELPIIYVIENNQYAMGTSVGRGSAVQDFSKHAQHFGIPGLACDGMDVSSVRSATEEAASHVRAGKGPIVIEMKTYRYRGHSMSDPGKYRPKEEVQEMRQKSDPIDRIKGQLIEQKAADEETLKSMDKEIRMVVAEAVDFAQNSAEPDPAELRTDITIEDF